MMSIVWSNAFTVMGLGLLIVFFVLIFLVFLLTGFSWFFNQKEKPALIPTPAIATDATVSEAEKAAIAMALHLYCQDVHDEESYVITIQKDGTPYNPWNSKIYGLNNSL